MPVTMIGLRHAMTSSRTGLMQPICNCRLCANSHATATFLDVLCGGAHATSTFLDVPYVDTQAPLTVTMTLTWVLFAMQLYAPGCGTAMLTFRNTMLALKRPSEHDESGLVQPWQLGDLNLHGFQHCTNLCEQKMAMVDAQLQQTYRHL